MKKLTLSFLTLVCAGISLPVMAADLVVASAMQRCTTNAECQLVTNSCADNCAFVPVNTSNLPAVQSNYQSRCGKPMDANPQCTMNPPLNAACVNSRCTIDYAYANHAGAKDYQAGAYPVPEKAEASKVPAAPYAGVDDKKGNFSAYNLPQSEVKQNTVGQIVNRVYVPPSAPVSGGNYVPVGTVPQAPIAQPASTAPVSPAIPPAAMPTNRTNATPPTTTTGAPVYTTPQPAPVPQAKYKDELYVPSSDTAPRIPSPGLPPAPRAAPVNDGAPAPVPQVGAPGVPQAPPGSIPIPPSDLKPAPTFVPPTGTAVPVAPEDPGAPPPAGTSMTLMPDGTMLTSAPPVKAEAKTFGSSAKTKEKYNLN